MILNSKLIQPNSVTEYSSAELGLKVTREKKELRLNTATIRFILSPKEVAPMQVDGEVREGRVMRSKYLGDYPNGIQEFKLRVDIGDDITYDILSVANYAKVLTFPKNDNSTRTSRASF